MKSQSTTQFISALVKNLQAVCHGNVEFDKNVKIVGHLFLTVDSATEFNYIVNEKVSKSDESSTTFISKSFYATDSQQKSPKKNFDRPLPQPTPDILGKTRVVNLDLSSDGQFSQNRYSTSSNYHHSFTQSPHYLSQSKKRSSNSRNSSPKAPKLSVQKEPIEIDLDSDLLVTFATHDTEANAHSVEESDNRVPPVHHSSDENNQKYDDYEIFHNVGFGSEEPVKDVKNLSIPLETPDKSPSNLSLSGTEISGHVDLSRVKAEARENPDSGEDLQNNSAYSQDEGDDSNIKQEDSEEFFNTLREQTMGLNTGTESNFDVPHLPGMPGASYLSVPSTSSDISKNAGVKITKTTQKKKKRCYKKNVEDQTKDIIKLFLNDKDNSSCTKCNKTFNSKKSLQIHLNSKHGKTRKVYYCQQCNEQFFSKNSYEGHTNKHNGRKLNCDKCSRSFYYPTTLCRHLLECSGQTISTNGRQCHVCGINTSTNESLHDHIKGVHGNELRYNCDNCNKSFKWRSSRLKHMESCSNQRFQCHVCGINCTTSQGLEDHIKGVHGNEPRYSCDYCDKPFKWRSTRIKHMESCNKVLKGAQ